MSTQMDAITIAEVALEVADYRIDWDTSMNRAEWRWMVVEKAIEIVQACNLTRDSEDIDETVLDYLTKESEGSHALYNTGY
jgi:hypothetical protein